VLFDLFSQTWAFPVAKDEHCLRVLRYVERNPLRARMTRSALRWRWSSLGRATLGLPGQPLAAGPVAKPEPWQEWVDQPETEAELTALRRSVARGVPFGAESWQRQTAKRLGLESSLRPVGRPSKAEEVP
jgi:putative transposase